VSSYWIFSISGDVTRVRMQRHSCAGSTLTTSLMSSRNAIFLVTYNGARFDLPFIKHEYPEIEFDQLHADLMYPLRRIGYTGGLKVIERMLGVTRSEDMARDHRF